MLNINMIELDDEVLETVIGGGRSRSVSVSIVNCNISNVVKQGNTGCGVITVSVTQTLPSS
ncbi:MAG: hypothetical protein K2Y18_07855 [Alphaproteobacteria bacterium]|jgi:hypothetical protein|nr:hypothetical protein [Alphaproteobacteria bacterium]